MNKADGKILKIILFIVLFGWLMHYGLSRNVSTFWNIVGDSLMLSCFAYIMMSLFGLVLVLSGNYFITIIVSLGLMFFGLFKLDEFAQSTTWLTNDVASVLICLVGLTLMARDILIIIGFRRNSGGGEAGPDQPV